MNVINGQSLPNAIVNFFQGTCKLTEFRNCNLLIAHLNSETDFKKGLVQNIKMQMYNKFTTELCNSS